MISNWKIIGIIATGIIVLMIPLSLLIHKPSLSNRKRKQHSLAAKNVLAAIKENMIYGKVPITTEQ